MNAATTHQLAGAYLTGAAVGLLIGLLIAVVVAGWLGDRVDDATRLPNPAERRPLADDDTTRTTNSPADLPRRTWIA